MKWQKIFTSLILSSALGAFVLLGMGGCGGGGSDETAAASNPLTKSQLIAAVGAICRSGDRERLEGLDAAAKRGEGVFESSPEGLEKLVETVVLPAFNKVISQLNDLQPAAQQQKVLAEITGDYEAAMEEAEAEPMKVATNNPFQAGDQVARSYGVKGCRLGA